ncbi:ComF family protein [Mycoplasmatota bacterium]|nr:ComF family protein [Mycoplasmatota bacterium]
MKYCLYCGCIIRDNMNFSNVFKSSEGLLCDECLSRLERVKNGCIRCGKKTTEVICGDCLKWESNENTKMFNIINYSLFYYNDFAKSMLKQVKFLGDTKLLLAFKKEIQWYFKKKKFNNLYLVPVPLHENRLNERGFNQSLFLAKLMPFPILDILNKVNNEKQSKKRRSERILFDNQYCLKEDINLINKNIMIVDDIYTTGATVHKIGRLLFEKNVKKMISFTLFRS